MTQRTRWARWMTEALDLTDTPAQSGDYLTAGQLSDAIGLAEVTILDPITRTPITQTSNPRSAICRPAARIGPIPLWSKEQLARYQELRAAREEDKALGPHALDAVSATEAEKRGLYSIIEYAEMLNLHDQTLRRAQSHDETFPPAVARRHKDTPGVPEHLFEIEPMINWAHGKGYEVPTGLLATQS